MKMNLQHIYVSCMIILVVNIKKTMSANVLVMSVAPCMSHTNWDKTLALGLREKGHNITFVSHIPQKMEQNFTFIHLEDIEKALSIFDIKQIAHYSATENIDFLFSWLYTSCNHSLRTKGFQQLLQLSKQNIKFDLILFDISSGICFLPVVELFGYPKLIATSPFGLQPYYVLRSFAVNLHVSYIPHHTLRYTDDMSFIERVHNMGVHAYDMYATWMFDKKCKAVMDDVFERDMGHVFDIQKNFSFLFVNYDPVLDIPRSLPPDVIPLGGVHIKKRKALPQDLQQFVDNSKNGVILYCLGTNIRSVDIGQNITKLFLETFSKLKQNVIWKHESDITNLPKNIIIKKYVPQNDILAHRNVKLFITHGGAMSTQETIYHGVPVIAMPFMIDQYVNTEKIINRKLGLGLSYKNLTVDYILSTINEVIYNPIYKQNIKRLSDTYHDRPDKPFDRAIYWMEYLLRTPNDEVLRIRTPQRSFNIIQHNLLDIYGFIIGIIVVIYILFIKTCTRMKTRKNKIKSQ